MRSTGITRKLDKLHRLVVPSELCDTMGLSEGTPMEIYTDGDYIILRKYEKGCVFCGDMDTMMFKDKPICRGCRAELRRVVS